MTNTKIYDVIILGAGPVGLYASFMAGYLKLKNLCLEMDDFVGGQPFKLYPNKYIYDFPGYPKIKAGTLIDNLKDQIKNYEEYSSLKTGVRIIGYEIDEDNIICLVDNNYNRYYAKNVLLTIGMGAFEPMKLENFPESHHHHKVRYCLEPDTTYENKHVLVLGGGDSALDYAYHIKNNTNATVTIAHRKDTFRANGLSKEELASLGINLLLNVSLNQWTDTRCTFVDNNDDSVVHHVDYDILLIQYGLKNLGSIIHTWSEFNKEKNKFIVNDCFETNIAGFYAAGSCIYKPNRINMIITGIGEATIVLNEIRAKIPNEGKLGW